MKKLLIISSFLMAYLFCPAQTQKGNLFLNGASSFGGSFLSSKTEYDGKETGKTTESKITFSPSVGYFFDNNFVLSLTPSFSFEKSSYDFEKTSQTAFSFGPSVRYYFGESKFKPFLQGELNWVTSKSQYEYSQYTSYNSTSKASGWGYGIYGGLASFLNDHISLDCAVGYMGSSYTDRDDSKWTNKVSGITFNFGFSLYL